MGLVDKALSVIGLQRKSTIWANGQGTASATESGEIVTATSALALSAYWACCNLISGTISSLPLQVYRTGPDGTSAVDKEHPLYPILHDSPNQDQTVVDFLDGLSMSLETYGNGYARKVPGATNKLVALQHIKPEQMTVRRLPTGQIEYRWSENGQSFVGSGDEVLHIRGPGGDPLGGLSTLSFARQSLGLAQAAERSAAGMFRNGLRPSGILRFKEWLTPEQRKIAHDAMQEKYLGAVNAGRPFIAEGGVEYEQLTISPEDAQMLETRQFSVAEICRFFGVPPVMIGHADNGAGWPSSVEAQMQIFYQITLRRRLVRIEKALCKQLLTPQDRARGIKIEFNIEGLLRGDSAGRAAFYATGLNAGYLTINEVRRLENLPRVEGGDTPRMQMQNVPITEAGQVAGASQ